MGKGFLWLDITRAAALYALAACNLFGLSRIYGLAGTAVYLAGCGFLAAALIIEEIYKNGGFSCFVFLGRRFTRLFPPLFLCVLFTLPFLLFLPADYSAEAARQAAGALSFTANLQETAHARGYYERHIPLLFTHTRLISMEMQFYIIWGLVTALAAFVCGLCRDKKKTVIRFKIAALALSAVFCGAAVFFMYPAEETVFFSGIHAYTAVITLSSFFTGCAAAAVYCMRSGFFITARITENTGSRPGKPLCDLALSFYLAHYPAYLIVSELTRRFAVPLTVILSAALAAVIYYGFERVFRHERPKSGINIREYKRRERRLNAVCLCAACILCVFSFYSAIYKKPLFTETESSFTGLYVMQDVFDLRYLRGDITAMAPAPVAPLFAGYGLYIAVGAGHAGDLFYVPPAAFDTAPQRAEPRVRDGELGVTVIGDSVTLGAQYELYAQIPDCRIDARVSRGIEEGYDIMRDMQNTGGLGDITVIALGTNSHPNYAALLTQFIDALEPGQRLVFVTPYDGRDIPNARTAQATAEWLRNLPEEYEFVTVADWNAVISQSPELLSGDAVHISNRRAAALFAECVAEATDEAAGKPAK